jgi:two-component system, LytTR family, sensor kinase
MKISIFNNKKRVKILAHVLIWMFLLILPWFFFNLNWKDNSYEIERYYYRSLIYGVYFYIIFLWVVPKFFFQQKKYSFFGITILLIIAFYFILDLSNSSLFPESQKDLVFRQEMTMLAEKAKLPRPPFKRMHIYDYILTYIFITGFSMGIRVVEKLSENEKIRKELEKEKLQSELMFLKYQVSPHFFFNTLNNIYSLIEFDTADAQKAVLRLSKMMRYLLYETQPEKALISTEIDFISNYIDLMRLRLTDKVVLNISLPLITNDFMVPPLLFIPFVENAFKHGISNREPSFIDISLKIVDQNIDFIVRNSISGVVFNESEIKTGIGLENVQKRLKLLFNNNYSLTINKTNNIHEVKLKINNV